jgi:hypothetical protein
MMPSPAPPSHDVQRSSSTPCPGRGTRHPEAACFSDLWFIGYQVRASLNTYHAINHHQPIIQIRIIAYDKANCSQNLRETVYGRIHDLEKSNNSSHINQINTLNRHDELITTSVLTIIIYFQVISRLFKLSASN